MVKLLQGSQTQWIWWSHNYQGYGDHQCLLIPCYTCKDEDCSHWRRDQCDDFGSTCGKWIFTPGLMVKNAYTELSSGGKNVTVVVRNSMTYPKTLRKKTPVAIAVTVTCVPEPPVQTGLTEVSEEAHGHQTPKITLKQRQKKLFEELDQRWIGILATQASSFCLISIGQIPHLLPRTQWTWLYPFNQTCD